MSQDLKATPTPSSSWGLQTVPAHLRGRELLTYPHYTHSLLVLCACSPPVFPVCLSEKNRPRVFRPSKLRCHSNEEWC